MNRCVPLYTVQYEIRMYQMYCVNISFEVVPIGLLNSARPLCIYYIKTSPTSRETEGGGRDEESRDG